jgi:hypothetical protein
MKAMLGRILNLLLVLGLLGSSGAFAQVLYVCQMDGQVHRAHGSCCCRDEQGRSGAFARSLEGRGCCDVQTMDSQVQQARPKFRAQAEPLSELAPTFLLGDCAQRPGAERAVNPEPLFSYLRLPPFLDFCSFRS